MGSGFSEVVEIVIIILLFLFLVFGVEVVPKFGTLVFASPVFGILDELVKIRDHGFHAPIVVDQMVKSTHAVGIFDFLVNFFQKPPLQPVRPDIKIFLTKW